LTGQATGDGSAIGTATGGMFIGKDLPTNYHERLVDAHHKIAGMLGQTAQKSLKRTVIAEHDVQDIPEQRLIDVKGFELSSLKRDLCFALLFLHLMFKDWRASTKKNYK
jgi:hypothetical protein